MIDDSADLTGICYVRFGDPICETVRRGHQLETPPRIPLESAGEEIEELSRAVGEVAKADGLDEAIEAPPDGSAENATDELREPPNRDGSYGGPDPGDTATEKHRTINAKVTT